MSISEQLWTPASNMIFMSNVLICLIRPLVILVDIVDYHEQLTGVGFLNFSTSLNSNY